MIIEDVRGTIIGTVTLRYRFYTRDGISITDNVFFTSDAVAIDWFAENYPTEYQNGAEMRRYED